MSALIKTLADLKAKVIDQGKSLLDGAVEHEDYAIWGKEFLKHLVSDLAIVAMLIYQVIIDHVQKSHEDGENTGGRRDRSPC
jgi:hypothetical protein